MWSWVLHRITGVSIYFFLLVHILDTSVVRISPQAYNAVIDQYKTPIMGARHQRLLFIIVILLWIVLVAGFAPRQISNIILEATGHPSA
jgi:succinate dehydrogenase / fumarate reductase cytochrome b subunit